MKYAGILLAAALVLGASGLSYAQETIKGKVVSVDEATGKISIQISGQITAIGENVSSSRKDICDSTFVISFLSYSLGLLEGC